ncbi:zinc finger BED domain-containing protein RICESLEEPER 2-like protein [Tanacetum coccineum]
MQYAPDPIVDTQPTSPSSENGDAFTDDMPTTEQVQEKETKNDGEKGKGEKRKGKEPVNLKSTVWDHFTRDAPNSEYANCNYCTRAIKCPSKNETSSLHNHLSRCKKYPYNHDKKQKLLVFQNQSSVQDTGDSSSTFVTWSFNQEISRKYCARMIILDELPFKTVEHEGFRDFVNMLQPQFQIPSRATITRDCMDLYVSEFESLKKYFAKTKQRVSLTTDLWSSRQNLSYMCLTAHFIDREWTMHKRILNFCPVSSHSGDIIGKYIEKSLLDWGIDKVLTITVDNASSNDTCLRYLKRRLNTWKKSVLESQNLHMRCCAHILSLVVKEGLKEVDDSVIRISCQSLVCLDVETRWNSTYLMLESAIKFQAAFDMLEEQDSKYRSELLSSKGMPTEEDWDYARCLLPFLRGFYTATLRISGSLYVTSNSYFDEVFGVRAMIKKKMLVEDESLKNMANKMMKKFDKYWSNISTMNMFLFIAPVLDPRHKKGYVFFIVRQSFEEDKAQALCQKIDRLLEELFEHYLAVVGVVNESNGAASEVSEADSAMDVDDDPSAYLNSQYKIQLDEASSSIGRVLDAFRSSLTPTLVEALICSQNWLRSKSVPFDIEEKLDDLVRI